MIVHTVCFSLRHESGSEAEHAFLAAARDVLPAIPGVRGFRISRQTGRHSDLAFQFSMEFEDQAAYRAYDAHPDHVAFVEERWKTEVSDFQELDFEPDEQLGR